MLKIFDIFCRIWTCFSLLFILYFLRFVFEVESDAVSLQRQDFQIRSCRIDGTDIHYYLGTETELSKNLADSIDEIDLTTSPDLIFFKYEDQEGIYFIDTRVPTKYHLYNHDKKFQGDRNSLNLKPVDKVFEQLIKDSK